MALKKGLDVVMTKTVCGYNVEAGLGCWLGSLFR
jgi:hypothetical protein